MSGSGILSCMWKCHDSSRYITQETAGTHWHRKVARYALITHLFLGARGVAERAFVLVEAVQLHRLLGQNLAIVLQVDRNDRATQTRTGDATQRKTHAQREETRRDDEFNSSSMHFLSKEPTSIRTMFSTWTSTDGFHDFPTGNPVCMNM